jgi:O-succinylbenzoate synthase
MMQVERVTLRQIQLPFLHFFETSFGRSYEKTAILVEIESDGLSGWGECVADEGPFYSYEDVETAWHILSDLIAPALAMAQVDPKIFCSKVSRIRGHSMAKAAAEAALWDLFARSKDCPLWRLIGGNRERIVCGVSIGIQDSVDQLLEKITLELEAGYQKIKIKIKPGWDVEVVREVRGRFPRIPLMVDANSAYTMEDMNHLLQLDQFNLLMIEQPLFEDDFVEHSKLQEVMNTPICLDESIRHARDARHACEMGSCRIVNIKLGRVGGFQEAILVHDTCQELGVPVWCGGMLETGIGRAHNIALSTLENFSIPGDVSAAQRYFERDTVVPAIEVTEDGQIVAPSGPGLGYEPDLEWIDKITVRKKTF